jgi:hypothetical protein
MWARNGFTFQFLPINDNLVTKFTVLGEIGISKGGRIQAQRPSFGRLSWGCLNPFWIKPWEMQTIVVL